MRVLKEQETTCESADLRRAKKPTDKAKHESAVVRKCRLAKTPTLRENLKNRFQEQVEDKSAGLKCS